MASCGVEDITQRLSACNKDSDVLDDKQTLEDNQTLDENQTLDQKNDESNCDAAKTVDPVKAASQIVEDLLHYRDHYFSTHSLLDASRKTEDLKTEIKLALEKLKELKEELISQGKHALYLTLRGRINNAQQSYSDEAHTDLSKAIKLDPRLSEAWNALGECYWQKGAMEEARNCFEGSLKHSQNKFALRNMSIVMRQLLSKSTHNDQSSPESNVKTILASVDKAREAVQMDTLDGMSWYVLGTAYLNLFFAANQSPKVLKQCLSAYSQAEKDAAVKNLADLHYNRAMAFKYMEEYNNAITGFHTAACLEPGWSEALENRDSILRFLRTLQDHVKTCGKIKGKKLTTFVNSIKPETALGPFHGGSYTNNSKTVDLTHTLFKDLTQGDNKNKVVLGKVTSSVCSDCITAFAFTMVDAEKNCVAVTMYNLKAGTGVIIGDTVAVAEPFMERVNFEFDPGGGTEAHPGSGVGGTEDVGKETFEFVSLRVSSPVMVVVNGKKWGRDKESYTEMRVSSQPGASMEWR